MQDYGKLEKHQSGIWTRDGEWYGTYFRRRMTVMALANGDLVVHNPFILKDEDLAQLKKLGKVAAVVVPNTMHGTEMGWMAEKLPEAQVLVPRAVFEKYKK